jgi:hypothetical protein
VRFLLVAVVKAGTILELPVVQTRGPSCDIALHDLRKVSEGLKKACRIPDLQICDLSGRLPLTVWKDSACTSSKRRKTRPVSHYKT